MLIIKKALQAVFFRKLWLFARYYLNALVWRVSVSRVFASTNFVISAMFIFSTRESFAKIGDAATFAVLAILALVMIDTVIVIRALNLLALVGPLRKYYFQRFLYTIKITEFSCLPTTVSITEGFFTVSICSAFLSFALISNTETMTVFTMTEKGRVGFGLKYVLNKWNFHFIIFYKI